ncbi:tripartite tricarboxylate transporter substrate binding protein [Roseomonas sp. AR75]|uniref:Bug family tripartite tricarboxylate transporter substrate binding protein n=1 Tax=Roseomonas sp. AR75 TaxID=2562311 RepID=UPI0010C0AE22|nr:tripartite tricarboxylate transporter substrate-binding protein [Roseomonas sp. AR75]
MTDITRRAALALPGLLLARGASAQDRPLRVVVPFPPGGTSDLIARLVQPEVQRILGQVVVVDNRGGAAGNLGADNVAKSPPDGTTVLLTDPGILTTSPSLFSRLTYDPAKDFDPVTMLIYAPYILAVHPGLPVRNAAELAAYAKANPGKINFAHSGVGALNHLTALVAVQHWGGEVTEVFYRGGMLGIQAASTGESQMVVNGATATLPFVKDGRLRAIAVTGPRRLADLPDVPTFAELGWPAAEAGIWQGLLAPAGTPGAIIERQYRAFAEALRTPTLTQRLTTLGAEVRADGPADFRRWLAAETEAWGAVIRARGIKLD